jgi:hypothetical protein
VEPALEGGVVDAERDPGVPEAAGGLLDVPDQDGDEGRVPVVGDDRQPGVLVPSRDEGQGVDGGEGGAAEEREPGLVVGVVAPGGRAVELGPGLAPNLGQERLVVDEDALDVVLSFRVEVAHRVAVVADGHFDAAVPGLRVLVIAVFCVWGRERGRESHEVEKKCFWRSEREPLNCFFFPFAFEKKRGRKTYVSRSLRSLQLENRTGYLKCVKSQERGESALGGRSELLEKKNISAAPQNQNAHRGAIVITRCPRPANSFGKPSKTSPRPPVLEKGATSALTKTIV